MNSSNQELFLNNTQKVILVLFFVLIISSLLIFRNLFFQPILILRSFGELSVEPEVAMTNNRPTFLEFYAEWCEVCKEMAPKISNLKNEYEKEINFVFLNVDNPKWENYLKQFNVNGIPQVNLLNRKGNLEETLVGKQEEKTITESLEDLISGKPIQSKILSSSLSEIKENKNYLATPRSHG